MKDDKSEKSVKKINSEINKGVKIIFYKRKSREFVKLMRYSEFEDFDGDLSSSFFLEDFESDLDEDIWRNKKVVIFERN